MNSLRTFPGDLGFNGSQGAKGRRAFTLTELVVAIGLLILMLTLAGEVMSLTIRTTGQATSLSEINQALRTLEQTLREDLRHADKNGVLLIQGNPINAYWTQAGRDADDNANPGDGYAHVKDVDRADEFDPNRMEKPRADILMFFTARRAVSYLDSEVTSQSQLVVYGHAELGEYVPVRGTENHQFMADLPEKDLFPSDPKTAQTKIPAEKWHLARRSNLLVPTAPPPNTATNAKYWANRGEVSSDRESVPLDEFRLDHPQLLRAEADIVANFDYDGQVLNFAQTNAGGGPPPVSAQEPFFLPRIFDQVADRGPWAKPFARSKLDLTPPPSLAERLGHFFLLHCASFKVEWTLDPASPLVDGRLDGEQEMFWFDPGAVENPDPAKRTPPRPLGSLQDALMSERNEERYNRLDQLLGFSKLGVKLGLQNSAPYTLLERFSIDPMWRIPAYEPHLRWNTVVFARRPNAATGLMERDEFFPLALRITVDVFDKARRLDRPIRHTMVIPVGGE